MRPSVAFVLLLGWALPAVAAEPALERVLLSTGGVGYLAFRAEGGDIRLRVPLRQVDDVLKSLTIVDGGGEVRAVRLPGPTPLDDPFRETPFGPGDLASLPQLLTRLQGALVDVAGPDFSPTPLRGRVLAIVPEETVDGDGRRTVRHRLSLLTDTDIRSVQLEGLDGVKPADPELRTLLGLVLARLADDQLRPERELAVELGGVAPDAAVRLGYLAEMPVWKASYRLVAGDADGLLQGWAVLENLSGHDWREVDVTLIAGSPIALRQALYRSYFVPRPEVPVLAEAKRPPAPMSLQAASRSADAEAAAAPPVVEPATAAELTAQTLYRLPRPVTLPEGETVMAPLVDRAVPMARLARYRAGQAGPHPEAALRLRNVAGASLPGGITTLYQRLEDDGLTFLGDAALPPLAPGEEAILAYGRDGNIAIDRREDGGRRWERARIVDGVLELTRVERLTTVYRITARFAGPSRELVVEQDLPPGWRVAVPARAEVEGGLVRVSAELAAGAVDELTIVTERPELERVALVDSDPDRLLLDAAGEVPPELKAALDRVRSLAAAVAEAERGVAATEERRAGRVAEQERLRANLEAVPPESDLARRYLDRLGASEAEIERLDGELEALRGRVEASARERREFLRTLRL